MADLVLDLEPLGLGEDLLLDGGVHGAGLHIINIVFHIYLLTNINTAAVRPGLFHVNLHFARSNANFTMKKSKTGKTKVFVF